MLTDIDVDLIRATREEIKQHRTEPAVLVHTDGTEEDVTIIFKEPRNPSGESARELGDYSVNPNDYNVSLDDTVNGLTAAKVIRKGRSYVFTDVDERGLGGQNRWECRAMLVMSGVQTIDIIKGAPEDGWGQITYPTPVIKDVPVFVSEDVEVMTNSYGEEAVTQLRVIFDGLYPLTYRDKIVYENEFGLKVSRVPVRIILRRRADGTPLVTEVYV